MVWAMKIATCTIVVAIALCGSAPVVAQSGQVLDVTQPTEVFSMLSYAVMDEANALNPADVFEIEISESGGITDVFVRLAPGAVVAFADSTQQAIGKTMVVSICGNPVLRATVRAAMTSGTLYIPNINAVQAEALRSVWHGRQTCQDIPAEVFPIAQ